MRQQQKSFGVYVATSFHEINLLQVMECVGTVWGKQPHKADRENYLYLVSAVVGTFVDSTSSVVINNTFVFSFFIKRTYS